MTCGGLEFFAESFSSAKKKEFSYNGFLFFLPEKPHFTATAAAGLCQNKAHNKLTYHAGIKENLSLTLDTTRDHSITTLAVLYHCVDHFKIYAVLYAHYIIITSFQPFIHCANVEESASVKHTEGGKNCLVVEGE